MSFDWLAPHYRWMEWLTAGGKLQRCRTAHLADLSAPREVLILGEGNGRFLGALVTLFPEARCLCVDASARMLALAERRLGSRRYFVRGTSTAECAPEAETRARSRPSEGGGGERVEFVHADILAWSPPPNRFDLIVTHFFLDCFRPDQLREIVPRIAAAATGKARWLLADFCEPSAGLAKWRARALLRVMYLFFRWTTRLPARNLTPPDGCLQQAGFVLEARQTYDWGMLHSDRWVRE